MSIHDMFRDAAWKTSSKIDTKPGGLLRDLDKVGMFANVNPDKDGWVD